MIALLLVGWFCTPAPILWSAIIAGLMLWPVLNALLALLFHPPPPGTRFWRDPRDRLLRVMLTVIFLADNAAMAVDAIVRVIYRRIDVASAAAGMGDGGRRSSAREKSATAIYSQPALDPRRLRAPFRRRSVVGNGDDGSRGPLPAFGCSLSGGGDGDQSTSEELAWRNANVG